ncbi:hypothetical protein BD324DRAFT_624406 [Kockovaella imperatae]|uniref:Uncharacterized protein n=1 Tax=Kockovaella imperatae TaxID=4999 RepID=A0A1Y1UJ30_9TREE|nr:hypothetical protein BD324DRAFT_624406 [Kockovaella imperatae]ORX38073.1 hypothetical protein BD324DRAFT_624406 [Kockovaella imperatae]
MPSTMRRSASATSSPSRPHRAMRRTPSSSSQYREPAVGSDDPSTKSQIYVLSADGSSLFLLDPSKPDGNEEPPPYAPFRITPPEVRQSGSDEPTGGIRAMNLAPPAPGISSPLRSPQSGHAFPPGTIITPEARARAVTLPGRSRSPHETPTRSIVRNSSSFTSPNNTRSARSTRSLRPPNDRTRSQQSIATSIGATSVRVPDERTSLLSPDDWVEVNYYRGRGRWRAIFCGEVEEGEEVVTWSGGWKRYWRTLSERQAWRGLVHLILLTFPFALLVWPFLLAGTLAGTALLITLPLGAAVWWLTLFLARSAARLEIITQLHYHSPLSPSRRHPAYHPIFHHPKEVLSSPDPLETDPDCADIHSDEEGGTDEVVWETRFIKCSYAMFCDHYSYSALVYFLLIKPLVVLFPTIFIVALFPVCFLTIFALPVYLRAMRRWGKWQAGIAVENL